MKLFHRRTVLAAFAGALALAGCALADSKPESAPLEDLSVVTGQGERRFKVEIADDEPERRRGLMFRQSMADDHGMLFLFPETAERSFWMKNTYIPLDIIYIGDDARIVSISREARPFDETPLPSFGGARAVLEINGGLAAKLGIEPGDRVVHPFFSRPPG